jgi:hypothetical protein
MLKNLILVSIFSFILAGPTWAQVVITIGQQQPVYRDQRVQIPPGHYYCAQHRQNCTHGYSTPDYRYADHRERERWEKQQKKQYKQWKKQQRKWSRRHHDDCDDD